ncbi:MAG: hypothetical protein EAZ53_07445 [Bacteroidetes bacterium]|nr:MAG: hypothetical protein EAZ53_07445 [Bacteroidota bacterium]
MYISDFKLVDILSEKMGAEEARTLVEYIGVRIEDNYVEAKKIFSTKEDLLKLEMKILENAHKNAIETQKLIADSKSETAKMFVETHKMIAESRIDFQKQLSDTLKWMIGMILGSTIAVIGTILTVMKMGGW